MPESKLSPRRLQAAERQRQALQLRLAGQTFEDIAEALGYRGPSSAYRAILAALKKTLQEPAEEVRTLEAERLDRLTEALWDPARAGDLAAIDRLLKIMDRRARLLGLDRPTTVDVTSGGERLESSADWLAVRGALMDVLTAWPEARAAVAEALEGEDAKE